MANEATVDPRRFAAFLTILGVNTQEPDVSKEIEMEWHDTPIAGVIAVQSAISITD